MTSLEPPKMVPHLPGGRTLDLAFVGRPTITFFFCTCNLRQEFVNLYDCKDSNRGIGLLFCLNLSVCGRRVVVAC